MGQYCLIVNVDKREFLDPHMFGEGLKFGEFAYAGDGAMAGLALLIANSIDEDRWEIIGRWAGDRVVITGDCCDDWRDMPDDVKRDVLNGQHTGVNLYQLCNEAREDGDDGEVVFEPMFENISMDVLEFMCSTEYMARKLAENGFFWTIHEGHARDNGGELPEFLKRIKEQYVVEKLSQ